MDDMVRTSRALQTNCSERTYGVEDPASIVFTSADRLSRSIFNYVGRTRSKGLLRKIYADECHLAVTAHNCRPKVAELSELRGIGAPLVVLMATAPGYMENDLESVMSSTRETTKYTVNDSVADDKLIVEAMRRFATRQLQAWLAALTGRMQPTHVTSGTRDVHGRANLTRPFTTVSL